MCDMLVAAEQLLLPLSDKKCSHCRRVRCVRHIVTVMSVLLYAS